MDKTQITFAYQGRVLKMTDTDHWRRFLEAHREESMFRNILKKYVTEHPDSVMTVNADGSELTN